MPSEFSSEELIRYSRHSILPEVGLEGQRRLKNAKVVLIGAGGLGSPAALYLAAAGVGTLGIVDFDSVDLSNLHRQVIHGTSDVGRSKLASAEATIREINPNVDVVKHEAVLGSGNAMELIEPYDYVVDGTDNFPTRYLVNDACVLLGKVNVFGSILGFEGQATVFCTPGGPCYRCLYPDPPPPGAVPSCAEGGVLGVLPGVIGLIQATETLKLIVGIGKPLIGRLLMYDALGMSFTEVRIRRDRDCPVCGDHPTVTSLIGNDPPGGVPELPTASEIEPRELMAMIGRSEPFTLLDVRTPREHAAARIPNSVFIPLAELPGRMNELDRAKKMVIYCHSGIRSANAALFLGDQGYRAPINLTGGIVAWADADGEVES